MSAPAVALLDYGSGNLRSAERALARVGAEVSVTDDARVALDADGLVVPGVGAFAACMAGLRAVQGPQVVSARLAGSRPVLGICVGMQVLFDSGVEHGEATDGCGQWPGVVEQLKADVLPHMGWNTVDAGTTSALFVGVERERFYFVHSYGVRHWSLEPPTGQPTGSAAVPAISWTEHGERFVAAAETGVLSATQFHPEKSGEAGLALLENWVGTLR